MTGTAFAISNLGSLITTPVFSKITTGMTCAAVGLIAVAGHGLSKKLIKDDGLFAVLAYVSFILSVANEKMPFLAPILMIAGGIVSVLRGFIAKKNHAIIDDENEENLDRPKENGAETIENEELDQVEVSRESDPFLGANRQTSEIHHTITPKYSMLLLVFFALSLLCALFLQHFQSNRHLQVFGTFYFTGSIIFGGGPVVIPLLSAQVVASTNWLTEQEFLFGLAVIHALPGSSIRSCSLLNVKPMFY